MWFGAVLLRRSSATDAEMKEEVAIKRIANAFDNRIDNSAYELMDTDLHQIISSTQELTEHHCQVSSCF